MEIGSPAVWRRVSSWILIVAVIGAGDDVTEAGVFCCVFWNIKFQVLDLEAGLGEGLRDMKEGEAE